MHVDHLATAGTLVEIVDVLGDDLHPAGPIGLQPGECLVRRVGLDRRVVQLPPTLVVEAVDERWIMGEGLGRGHILRPMAFPQAAGAAKRGQARLGGDAGSGQDDDRA